MRPEALFPLFKPLTALKGVGPRLAEPFERLCGPRILDLIWHFPAGLVDRGQSTDIMSAPVGSVVTLAVRVDQHQPPPNARVPYRVLVSDGSGFMTLVFFRGRGDYLRRVLPPGEERVVSGKLEDYQGRRQITHPDYMVAPEVSDEIPEFEPQYPLTAGLSQKVVRKTVEAALAELPALDEWLDPALRQREGFPAWHDAVLAAHHPQSGPDLEAAHPARRRLAYDELLANQLALALVRRRARRPRGRSLKGDGRLVAKALGQLPYRLTGDQQTALAEIQDDMAGDLAMLRLVQGDVGSGKTIVAFLAMLTAVECGGQAALLAPTEILSRQHYEELAPMAAALGLRMELLTGRVKGAQREAVLADLAAGEIDLLVGTHALIQQDVAFHDLALAIVDEQHRFGVFQRLALAQKARHAVDVLVMTATPIPRTLTMTVYGDMDVSRIVEKPPGRKPVETRVVSLDRLEEVAGLLARAMAGGARIYWVCPLVSESEVSDVAAAEDRFEHLRQLYGDTVGLVHGQMKGPEKDAVMADFAAGQISILVATTVIEVGVNVPEATIMVIEHAERFGLAQLHQLRGRVGRGSAKSTCLLLRSAQTGETGRKRLNVMKTSDDGFFIAEEDLRLRGAGEVLGTRQSGLPTFRVASVEEHGDLMAMARDDAMLVMDRDPDLKGPRGQQLRVLLYLFERDSAIKLLQSG